MAKPSPVISDHPPAEMYQPGLEIECQCARCGGSCGWTYCCNGCDDGYIDRHDEDPLWYGHELYTCDVCRGRGGWNHCGNSTEWCEANPLPGRDDVPRGKIEWFVIEEQPNG
jgi:hypothetical protein